MGSLLRVDGKDVVLKLEDGRTLRMNRTGKTKFYKDSKQIKADDFGPGDHVSVDATNDQQGFLSAISVTLDKAATPEERAEAIKAGDRTSAQASKHLHPRRITTDIPR